MRLQAQAATGQVDVVSYFLSRREADADTSHFLAAVVPQLAHLVGVTPQAFDVTQFRALWEQAATRAANRGRHLLLVVDGLDEDLRQSGNVSVAAVLPTDVGAHAHVLVSSRPCPELPGDLPIGHPLLDTYPVILRPFEGSQELQRLAMQEIEGLVAEDAGDLAISVLGTLTAATGSLTITELAEVLYGPQASLIKTRHIRQLVSFRAARSLQRAGHLEDCGGYRYQFAHLSLLEYAQAHPDLSDEEHRRRLHAWADAWRDRGWPPLNRPDPTPLYLLDGYLTALASCESDRERLVGTVSDPAWITAAICVAGVDSVLGHLREARALAPCTSVSSMIRLITGQLLNLVKPHPVCQPGYVLRQLWLEASELGLDDLAICVRTHLLSEPAPDLVPVWTSRRSSGALVARCGPHVHLSCIAGLPDGRVVTADSADGQLLVWDPTAPDADPQELGHHPGGYKERSVRVMTVLLDGRVATGDGTTSLAEDAPGHVMVWDPASPGAGPRVLGRHPGGVNAIAVLPDGQIVTGNCYNLFHMGQLLAWDPTCRKRGPRKLGEHPKGIFAITVLPDGCIISVGPSYQSSPHLLWDRSVPEASPPKIARALEVVGELGVSLPDGRIVSQKIDRLLISDPAKADTDPREMGWHFGWARLAALSDGRFASVGTFDGRVLLWDPATLGANPYELGQHPRASEIAALPDGRITTGCGQDGNILIWDPAALKATRRASDRDEKTIGAVMVLPDGRVVTGESRPPGVDGQLLVWDPATPDANPHVLGRHSGGVYAMAMLPDGRVLTAAYQDERVLIWDPTTPEAGPYEVAKHAGGPSAMAVLPDGRVVTGDRPEPAPTGASYPYDDLVDRNGRILIWAPPAPRQPRRRRLTTEVHPRELGRQTGGVTAMAVLPDGRLVTGDSRNDGQSQLLVWDTTKFGGDPHELGRQSGGVSAMAVLADGRVVTGDPSFAGEILVWDPATPGAEPVQLGELNDSVVAIAALPDGRVVVGGATSDRVLLLDPSGTLAVQEVACSVTALAAGLKNAAESVLVIAHKGSGWSLWCARNLPGNALLR